MTMAVFPELDGMTFERDFEVGFVTQVFRPSDLGLGNEAAVSLQQHPVWSFSLNTDFLLDDDDDKSLKALLGFFCARYGRGQTWLFYWDKDGDAVNEPLGTGNGVRTGFQLQRSMGGFVEPVNFVRPVENPLVEGEFSPYLFVNGVPQAAGADYTLSASGLVSFTVAPPTGAMVTWTGGYYYACRFADDRLKGRQHDGVTFDSKSIKFYGSVVDIL